jgi:hypothetical protein
MKKSVEDVSFTKPFFDEISKYPVRFSTPVFFGESPYSSYSALLRNGTATLLKLQDKFLGVTCQHVLEGYRCLKASQEIFFQIGPVRIDPEKHLISEDRNLDLAIFDLTQFIGKGSDLNEAKFVHPTTWPPRKVSKEDVLCLSGFPGIWREQKDPGHVSFYSFSSGTGEVFSVRENEIVTRVQIEDCITQINFGKILGSLGGLSGGPVFAWRKTSILIAELIGFIYEYQESLDLMLIRAAKVIRDDGTLYSSFLSRD